MSLFELGARLHDYGKGTPDEMFRRIAADGFTCTQLAYRKSIAGVGSYADVTPELVEETIRAGEARKIRVAVLGTYVELAVNDEKQREENTRNFISQLAVCRALNAGCIGTETTNMAKQPAGTSRERAQYMLCKSLESILPAAEELGVTAAIEPVSYHSVNTPEAAKRILDTMQSPNLKVIFDPANLLPANEVNCQEQLWDRMGNLLGAHIMAVHFKGETFDENGKPVSSSLEDSVVDYAGAFAMLKQLGRPLPVLREEAVPARAAEDIRFMRQFF